MARTITDEDIKLNIIINGNPAQKQLLDLEKETRKLTEQKKSLGLELLKVEKKFGKNSQEAKLLKETIQGLTTSIDNNKATMKELQNQIGLTGLTMSQLVKKSRDLNFALNNAVPGGEAYAKYKAELLQVETRLNELKVKAQTTKLSISSIANGFNKYQALAFSIIATLTGVVFSIQKIIDINGKLSDAQADVMKTTGMTKKEVDELTKSFGLLETRTSRIDLLKIAEQGGRIGIVKGEIGTFVDVMNKANVALGDSFQGGVEEVANKLGKLKFLFAETKDLSVDKAYNAIGSAINDLGANGVASEANITEFATRLGSLPDVLKPSIREALALGAAFEESGIEAEVSSRAYNIFMKQASTESGKFAQVMKLTKKQVEDMINTNPLDFMMKFAEGMRGMDATETAKTLDFLGVNADGANKVIGAMGNNMSRFRELIDLSNNSFVAGTSLIKEYNVKNENLAATLEKIQKTVIGWFSSDTFVKWLAASVNWLAKLIGATEDADGSVTKWRNTFIFTIKIISILIASMISYSLATKVATALSNGLTNSTLYFNIALKAQTFWLSLQKVALIAYTSIMGLFGFTTDKATASLARLNVVTKLSPWGALLAVITAVIVAYVVFADSNKKAATAQETFAKQMKEASSAASKSTAETKANIASLVSLIKDESVSMGTRKKAYEDLIKISPVFNGFLKDEKFNIEGLLSVYEQYIKQLDRVAYAKQIEKLNEENIKKQIEAQQLLFEAEREYQRIKRVYKNDKSLDADTAIGDARNKVNEAKENLKIAEENVKAVDDFRIYNVKALEKSIIAGEKALAKIIDKSSAQYQRAFLKLEADKAALDALRGKIQEADTKSNFNVPGGNDTNEAKKQLKTQEELNRIRLDNEAKFEAEMLRLKRQYEDDRLAIMNDSYEKDVQLEDERYQREIDDLERQKIHKDELAKIDEEIAKAKQDKDTKYKNFLIQQKKTWEERNQSLDDQINKIIETKFSIHKLKLGVIEEKWAQEKIKKADEKFKRELIINETNFNNQLNQLKTLEEAKALLKGKISDKELSKIKTLDDAKKELIKQFQKKELEDNVNYLNDLLAKMDEIISSKQFEGIDLDLLTPEQKDKFQKQIEEAKKLKSELEKALSGTSTDADTEKRNQDSKQTFMSLGGGADILGFTPQQWQQAYDNLDTFWGKMAAGTMVVMALQNAWGSYNDILTKNENSRLRQFEMASNRKKTSLDKQLKAGILSQTQYDKAVTRIDDEYNLRKAQLEYKQAKRQKTMAITDVIVKTAMAIMQGYAQLGPIDGTIAAVLLGTIGALQINAISKQPLPSATGYEKGLYGDDVKREQDGKIFKSSGTSKMQTGLFSKPHILVGEGPEDMPEMVIDKRAYSQISPATKNALLNELRGIKGFERGQYNNKLNRIEVPANDTSSSTNTASNSDLILAAALNRNSDILEKLEADGIMAWIDSGNTKEMLKLQKQLTKAQEFKNKSKI